MLFRKTFSSTTTHISRSNNKQLNMSDKGDVAQEVRPVVWQSEGCRFDPTLGVSEVSLSKTPNPQLVGTLHGSQSPLVCECVCE